MKFGCCINSLEHIGLLKKTGFDYAEVSVQDIITPLNDNIIWKERRDIILQSGISIEVANSFLNIMVIQELPDYSCINRYLENCFERARSIGVKIIGFGSGQARNIPSHMSMENGFARFWNFLQIALDHAEKSDIIIGLEPLNQQETNNINSIEEAAQLIEQVNSPYLRLLADYYHINMENDSLGSLGKAKHILVHVHVADHARKCPGFGNYDFNNLFLTLNQIGFEAGISIESDWKSIEELKASLEFLKRIYQKTCV